MTGSGKITEEHLMDKISRMFHTFPLEFQQSYRLQLEYPIGVDEHLPSGAQKEKRPDSLLYSPSNLFIVETKASMLMVSMIHEVIVERRYLQRVEKEIIVPDDVDVKMLFLAPQIHTDCRQALTLVNAVLGENKYLAMSLKQFAIRTMSWFNSWCESNPSISEFHQNSITRRIESDCSVLFLFD